MGACERAQHMVAGGALALLLAGWCGGRGRAGRSQPVGLTAGDPSQWA
ncbi:MAG: hypothetical protein U0232_03635 [Thermomicrobiales bacterium]